MFRKDVFAAAPPPQAHSAQGLEFSTPIHYRRLDCFFAVFGADAEAVKKLLPSPRLSPVLVWPGRCMVALNAFNYLETDIGPYGEFSVAVPCFLQNPVLKPGLGVYIHRLPVTTELALVAGLELWGYPKFVCDMKFKSSAFVHWVRLEQEGRLILELSVKKGALAIGAGAGLNTVTIKDGDIIQTGIQSSSILRASPFRKAELKLGDHEMGSELAGLGLARRPLVSGDLLDANMLLPLGVNAGPA